MSCCLKTYILQNRKVYKWVCFVFFMVIYNSDKQGVKRSSIEKVWNVLVEEDRALTPSNISEKINLQVPSVKSCLALLDKLGKVEIMTNGRTWLVREKKEREVTNK